MQKKQRSRKSTPSTQKALKVPGVKRSVNVKTPAAAAHKLPRPLAPQQVFLECKPSSFELPDDKRLKKSHEIIAQDRAVQAINFGLGIRKPGYNIYVAGSAGTGKTSVIQAFLQKWSKGGGAPVDWIYVYNFQDSEIPKALQMKAGEGKVFKKRMENLIKALREEITKALHSEDYENPANSYLSSSNDRKAQLYNELESRAKALGFIIKSSRIGIETIPILHGRPVTDKEYAKLDADTRNDIEKRRSQLEPNILEFARKVRDIELEGNDYIEKLRKSLGQLLVAKHLHQLYVNYQDHAVIIKYLDEVGEHIVENLLDFVENEELQDQVSNEEAVRHSMDRHDRFVKYRVNVFVDNSGKKASPVVIESNPTYYNLFGRLEKNVEYGMYRTDFTMIKAGAVHRANGGYLVLNASDIFRSGSDSIWEFLKRVLKNQMGFIEDMGEQYSLLPTSGLRPEPIQLDIKVIIIGSDDIYHLLFEGDEEFRKIFKIKADFNHRMPRQKENLDHYANFVFSRCKSEGLLPAAKSGVSAIIEHGSRLVDDQKFVSTQFGDIKDLLIEADYVARSEGSRNIQREHVEKAIEQKTFRVDLIEEHLMESVKSLDYLVDVDGERVGQINALTVYDLGDHQFGRAGRVTCTTSMNQEGIFNVERASKLSGKIHDKGVYILSGFLSALLARETSLGFSASVAFEQSYGYIDGDSATVAELVAIVSSLSGIPIKQNYAVTGSLNQLGDVQPIGGINEKIEGFYKICQLIGKSKVYNVVVPFQNVTHMMLQRPVREAVESGKLKIFPIQYFWQAFELMTGVAFGAENIHAKEFPKGSALATIHEKLVKLHGRKAKHHEPHSSTATINQIEHTSAKFHGLLVKEPRGPIAAKGVKKLIKKASL